MMYKDIFEAASNNNLTAVKQFIEVGGIPPDKQNFEGDTVAHIATQNNNISMLKYLLKKDPTLLLIRGQAESTLLEIAIAINSLTLVEYLVKNYEVDIYEVHCDQPPPDTYVHFAAEMGNLEVFKYFIEEKKVPVNLKNKWEQPPAFAAARESHLNIIKYIVEVCKGDVTTTDKMGRNILCQSAVQNDLTVPKYLLDEKKLKININNAYIIQDAISSTKHTNRRNELDAFLKYFVEEKRMNINAGKDAIPLHRAANLGMVNVVQYLIHHGADIQRQDFLGRTPLQVATDKDVVKCLEEARGKRTRRSQSLVPSIPQSEATSFQRMQKMAILGPTETESTKQRTDYIDIISLIIFANAYISSKFPKRVNNVIVLSPLDIMENRIDPVAVDAIHGYLSSE